MKKRFNKKMDDEIIHCMFQEKLKNIRKSKKFEEFKKNCMKEFKCKNDQNSIEFYIYDEENQEQKIIIKNQEDYFRYVLNDDENDSPIINMNIKTNTPDSIENENLKKEINSMLEEIKKLKNDILFYTNKTSELEKNYYILNNDFQSYKKSQEKLINKIIKEISNNSINDNSYSDKQKINKKQITPNPLNFNEEKPHIRTPGENKNQSFDNNKYKKNINEQLELSKEINKRNENKYYENSRKEINKKGNFDINYNNGNYNNNKNENNYNNENNEDFINENNIDSNNKTNNNENDYNENFNNSNNSDTGEEFVSTNKENSTKKNIKNEKEKKDFNINEINSIQYNNKNNNNYSCEFIKEDRTLVKLKSNFVNKKKNNIRFEIKIKNNGIKNIPKNSKLKSKENDNESDLYIAETLINNGQEIKPNEIIDVTLYAFFKDPNNIKDKENYLKFILINDECGQIGNEEIIKIFILDESDNIIDNVSKTFKKDEFSIFNDAMNGEKTSKFYNMHSNKNIQNNNENDSDEGI